MLQIGIEGMLEIITLLFTLMAIGITLEVKKRSKRSWNFLLLAVVVFGIRETLLTLNFLGFSLEKIWIKVTELLFILILSIAIWKLKR